MSRACISCACFVDDCVVALHFPLQTKPAPIFKDRLELPFGTFGRNSYQADGHFTWDGGCDIIVAAQ